MPISYNDFMKKTNGSGIMSNRDAYSTIRGFSSDLRTCSSNLFDQLMTARTNNPNIDSDPEYQARSDFMSLIESLGNNTSMSVIDFGDEASDEQKQIWKDNVDKTISDVSKLLEPDNFKRFMDFATSSDDPDMWSLPAKLQKYINVLNTSYEAGIDPELFATRTAEYTDGLRKQEQPEMQQEQPEMQQEEEIVENKILGDGIDKPEVPQQQEELVENKIFGDGIENYPVFDAYQKKNGGQSIIISDKKAYDTIRDFQSGMGNLSTQDFGALFSFGVENGQGPEYQSWEAYHQVIDSLQSGAILLSVEPKQSSPGKEKQRWEDNVAEVIGNTKKLLEPENFNRFMDAVVNSTDKNMKTLPNKLQNFIGVLNEHYGAGIDPKLFNDRYKEETLKEWEAMDAPDEQAKKEAALATQRDEFSKKLDELSKGLHARHRGDLAGLFSGATKEMQELRDAIADYQAFRKNPKDPKFEGNSEFGLIDQIRTKADDYYEAKMTDPRTGETISMDSKSKMGQTRARSAQEISELAAAFAVKVYKDAEDAEKIENENGKKALQADKADEVKEKADEVKETDTYDYLLKGLQEHNMAMMLNGTIKKHLTELTAISAMIEKYGEFADRQPHIDEYQAKKQELNNDPEFQKMLGEMSDEDAREKCDDPEVFYNAFQQRKAGLNAPQQEEPGKQQEPEKFEKIDVEPARRYSMRNPKSPDINAPVAQEIPFEQQKLDFADLAAETFLRHFHKQQVDDFVKQNPGTKPEQFRVEDYLSANKESYMKEDENFLSFMDTVKDQPTLDQMKAKSPDELHQYYASGQFRKQAAPEQELIVENKILGDGNVDLEAKIEAAQKQLKEHAAKTKKYPIKKGAQQEYAAIATAHFVRSQQKNGEMLDMSDQGFEDLVKETVNSKPFHAVIRKYDDKDMYDKATRDKGQDMYAALSTARKQYKEYLDAQKNGVQMKKSDPNLQQGGFQKK